LSNSQITPKGIDVLSQSPNEVLSPSSNEVLSPLHNIDISCLTPEYKTSILNSGAFTSSQGTVQCIATTSSNNTAEKVIVILILLLVSFISNKLITNKYDFSRVLTFWIF